MIAFGIRGGKEAGARFMDALAVAKRAVSLGRELLRVSIGLEDVEALRADFSHALESAVPAQV